MTAYIFDVDGVITDPVEKRITKLELVKILASKLEQKIPVAFITGRGLDWLKERVISVLENYLDEHPEMDKTMLDNLFVSGEFGGVYLFHENGERKESVNPDFSIPDDLRDKLNQKGEEYNDFAFIEHEKRTQFTMEARSGNDFFGEEGKKIAEALQAIVKDYPQMEVHTDRLGMNVKNKEANKRYVVGKFINWLTEKQLQPENYTVFGDSPSDLEMGDELYSQSLAFNFIFVGDEKDLNGKNPEFEITITKEHCDAGTVEFLASK